MGCVFIFVLKDSLLRASLMNGLQVPPYLTFTSSLLTRSMFLAVKFTKPPTTCTTKPPYLLWDPEAGYQHTDTSIPRG